MVLKFLKRLELVHEVINRYFSGTASQIGGIGLETIAEEAKSRHNEAYENYIDHTLDSGSDFQWRSNGEHHAFNPNTIHMLQWSARKEDYDLYKKYLSSWRMKNELASYVICSHLTKHVSLFQLMK